MKDTVHIGTIFGDKMETIPPLEDIARSLYAPTSGGTILAASMRLLERLIEAEPDNKDAAGLYELQLRRFPRYRPYKPAKTPDP